MDRVHAVVTVEANLASPVELILDLIAAFRFERMLWNNPSGLIRSVLKDVQKESDALQQQPPNRVKCREFSAART
jgi:hypothetical protein